MSSDAPRPHPIALGDVTFDLGRWVLPWTFARLPLKAEGCAAGRWKAAAGSSTSVPSVIKWLAFGAKISQDWPYATWEIAAKVPLGNG